jgi:hypothetical protein
MSNKSVKDPTVRKSCDRISKLNSEVVKALEALGISPVSGPHEGSRPHSPPLSPQADAHTEEEP